MSLFIDSTLWLAKAAKQIGNNSKVISLEYSEKHAKVARQNIKSAGYDQDDLVQVIVGDARQTIQELVNKGEKFDLFFIDADKSSESCFHPFARGRRRDC